MSLKLLSKPPRIKVLEAIGAIGDGRIRMVGANKALVTSSTGEKEYTVVAVKEGADTFRVFSNDNGTVFKSYIGYPIISLLILMGELPLDNTIAKALSGIPWKELNEKYQKYAVVENIVISRAERLGVPRTTIDEYVNIVYKKLGLIKVYFDESLMHQ
ncbi:hypothetical protein [Thermosphaera aggregans]|uniref:Uncharacterized protein n=1 Tax=Thermosphaera aggregans (strain DSM 11486 / M11TL) TaxID=633148 RepID=D5TZP9_THEAM|nr:hypothetical protein [Thermosphaera aggregans]ADG90349.1 hypothetical protein Tagg_0067 [Thermosphaera aggregans DSM 11486]